MSTLGSLHGQSSRGFWRVMRQAITRSLQAKIILALALAVLIPTTIISVYTDRTSTSLLSDNRPTTDKTVNAIAEAQTALLRSFLTSTGGAFRRSYVLDAKGHLRIGV